MSFRIFWSLDVPKTQYTNEEPYNMKSFAGVANVWRMDAWNSIPNYPEWFIFYREEDFAAFQLFKKGREIHYLPKVLVNHRVDIKSRKKEKDYQLRLRRSLRSGWYLYFLFYPWQLIPRKLAYTLWIQLKTKVFKGDVEALITILQAIYDVLMNIPRLLKNSNRLTLQKFEEYSKLPNVKLYWEPER
jgi:GT2 family glycosyltransferase